MHDWTIEGVHLCTTRLRLLEVNTADAFDPIVLSDVDALRSRTGEQLRRLGRLGHPMRRNRGERGFRQISWDEALDALGSAIGRSGGERAALYLTSRGLTNESYYVAGKAARAMGMANVDSAARVCHAPSTLGLKQTIGVAASTCSLQDVLESDLIVIWGSNPANNQPVFMKYLFLARKRGTRVVVVNPYLEPGLERYWVPSNPESAMFGTKMCDLHVPVRPGGDVALANALLKRLIERGAIDEAFIDAHTADWPKLVAALEHQDLDDLCRQAGVSRAQIDAFADEYAAAGSAILLWSMGITQHRDAVDGVRAIVNVALARGNVGRDGAGLMPIRGHSGVQGGAEMGAYATAFPGGATVNEANAAQLSEAWGFAVPTAPGLTAPEMVEAAERDELDVLWMSGGNFLDVLPDPPRVEAALGRVPLRVHQDIVLTSQMLVPGDDVILLPVCTRYEQEGGGTETTTERRIAFSPEIPRQVGEARSEWRLFADVARRVRPDLEPAFCWPDNQALRAEIAQVVPVYAGIEKLAETGDQVQWGGRHLCADGEFATPNGRGRVQPARSRSTPRSRPDSSRWRPAAASSSTRWCSRRPIHSRARPATRCTSTKPMPRRSASAKATASGSTSETGEYVGRVKLARLPHRTLQVHWPEGNVLIAAGPAQREPGSKVPDYNAVYVSRSSVD